MSEFFKKNIVYIAILMVLAAIYAATFFLGDEPDEEIVVAVGNLSTINVPAPEENKTILKEEKELSRKIILEAGLDTNIDDVIITSGSTDLSKDETEEITDNRKLYPWNVREDGRETISIRKRLSDDVATTSLEDREKIHAMIDAIPPEKYTELLSRIREHLGMEKFPYVYKDDGTIDHFATRRKLHIEYLKGEKFSREVDENRKIILK